MSAEPRFIPRATTDERIKVRLHVARREPLRTHARSVPVCWRFLGQGIGGLAHAWPFSRRTGDSRDALEAMYFLSVYHEPNLTLIQSGASFNVYTQTDALQQGEAVASHDFGHTLAQCSSTSTSSPPYPPSSPPSSMMTPL